MRIIIQLLIAFFLLGCHTTQMPEGSQVVGSLGENGMVTTAHPLATKIGVGILKNGGNAFDAAIAVKFALAVVFPRAGNIGGGGFAVYRIANGEIGSLDFREKAPASASRDMYLDGNSEVLKDLSTIGHQATGVPGTVDGMFKLHERHGSKPMAELMQPAIELATNGYTLTSDAAAEFNLKREDFQKVNGDDFFLLKHGGWQEGDTIKFLELANTLSHIKDEGRDAFYMGTIAKKIVDEMQQGGGYISMKDLANYDSKWRKPVVGLYRGHKVISMAPPSSGGVALLQLLQGAEEYDLITMGHNTKETIHILTELERRVFADRATHLGDPDFYKVPVEMLLSPEYNKERFSTIRIDEKTDSQAIKEGSVEIIESVQTTHFSIVDNNGNAVSITTTLNNFFGSKVYVRGAGFFLNNTMDDFSLKPGVPNQFGLVGGDANAIAPEKRMLSTMTPTIVEKDGKLKMVVGTPGGATIITSVFQTIMNVIDHGMSMQQAVNARRVHSQWLPDKILIEEGGVDELILQELKEMGHVIEFREKMGRMDCILIREDGKLEGAADYTRGDDYAEGY